MNIPSVIKRCPKLAPFVGDKLFPKTFPIVQLGDEDGFRAFAREELEKATKRRSVQVRIDEAARPKGEDPFRDCWGHNDDKHLWDVWIPRAAHEAGHAVVAFVLGWKPAFVRVCYFGDEMSRYESTGKHDCWKKLPSKKRREYWECELALKAGAIAAQKVLLPDALDYRIATIDFEEALELGMRLVGAVPLGTNPLPSLNRLLIQAAGQAERIVEENREAVLAVAREALVGCGIESQLRGGRIEEIFEAHGVAVQRPRWNLSPSNGDALRVNSKRGLVTCGVE